MPWSRYKKQKQTTISVSELAYFAANKEDYLQFGMSVRHSKAAESGTRFHNQSGSKATSKFSLTIFILVIGIGGLIWLLSH